MIKLVWKAFEYTEEVLTDRVFKTKNIGRITFNFILLF